MLQTAQRSRWTWLVSLSGTLVAALFSLFAAAYVAFDTSLFADGDTSWHIATGRWILEHGAVPFHDPFSFTMPGKSWHAHEWLAEVPMALAYDLADWRALALPFVAAFAFTLFLIGRELSRHFPVRWMLATVAAVFNILFAATLARPHLFAWAILVSWLLLLLRAREAHRAPPLLAILLMVVWANMHASYIVGLGLVGVFALEALVQDRSPAATLRAWVPFGLLSLAAACVTPFGIQGFLYPFQVSGMEALSVIGEWRQTRVISDGIFLAYFVVVVGFAALSWRRVGIVRLLLTAALAYMALKHIRHQQLFALVTVLAVIPLAMARFTGRDRPAPAPAIDRWTVVLLAAGFLLISAVRLMVPLEPKSPPGYMGGAFEAVPAELRSKPVFNTYSFGGPLILRGVKVFIDGRADMYGDRFTLDFDRMSDGDVRLFQQTADRYGIEWVILWKADALSAKLDKVPGWRRIHSDEIATVHVRERRQPQPR
ncbi:hypothetical protein [Sphingomonas arenae]|uniref:hypothetical protein n=1 Tax=Sphingomonas arenae TaxID=2812555 RepID=UPI001966DAD7|nr:hypothetical protein [Sphingomonas arenae]